MKNKTAINIIKRQIVKLSKTSGEDLYLWQNQTCTYILSFFNDNSYEYSYIKNYTFFEAAQRGRNSEPKSLDKIRKELNLFLNNCIETINDLGLYKPPVDNWFSKLPNWLINLGLPTLCFISFSFGILFTNNNNRELINENKKLNNKLLLISSDSISNKYKGLSNKIIKHNKNP